MNIIFLLCIVGLSACSESRNTVKNKEEAIVWFSDNKNALNDILTTLFLHTNIKWVEDMNMEFIPTYGDFSDKDKKAYEALSGISKRLGIISISVARRGNIISGDIITVNILLVSKGNVTAGYALNLKYIQDAEFIDKAKKHDIIFHQLNDKNWYIAESF